MRRTLRWLSVWGHNKAAVWGVTLLFDVLGNFFMLPRLLYITLQIKLQLTGFVVSEINGIPAPGLPVVLQSDF